MVRTTLVLPEELWKRAKFRALEEGIDLRTVLLRGLDLYLARPMKMKKGGG